MPSGRYPYEIVITNVTNLPGKGTSEPASTTLYVGKAADLLIGTYSLAYVLTNPVTGAAEYYYSPLVNQSMVLPGTPVTAYVFGANMTNADVYLVVWPQCGIMLQMLFVRHVVGYIIDGTLWGISSTGQYVKGVHLTAGTTLPLCSGLNLVILAIGGQENYLTQFFTQYLNYISEIPAYPVQFTLTAPGSVSAGTALEVLASKPVSLYLNYISVIPTYPVQFTLTAPGSVDAGTALEVLVSGQVSVMGLPAYQVSPFFIVSAPAVTAYVVTSSGVVKQLPVSLLTTIPDEYYVYLVSVPSNVSGTLFVEATVTATYIFTGHQFVGQQAAAVGILPPPRQHDCHKQHSEPGSQGDRGQRDRRDRPGRVQHD